MKTILIISLSFPPSNAPGAQRPYFLAKCISKYNYTPIVLTPEKAYSALGFDAERDFDFKVVKTGNRTFDKLYADKKSLGTKKKSFVKSLKAKLYKRIIPEITIPDKGRMWKSYAIKALSKIDMSKVDVVYSTSPSVTNHLIAMHVKERYNIPWLADFRDFYFTNHLENKNFLFRKAIDKRIEEKVIRFADHVCFVTDSMLNFYQDRYPSLMGKSTRIYNGFDLDTLTLNKKPISKNCIKVFYGGSFYGGIRSPLPLLRCIEKIYDVYSKEEIRFEITVAGNVDPVTLAMFKESYLFDSIHFLGQIPKSEVGTHIESTDILWMITGDDPNHYMTIPLKYFEYLATGKMILSMGPKTSEVRTLIEKYNKGIFLENSNQIDVVTKNAEKVVSALRSEEKEIGKTKEAYFPLSRQAQVKEFVDIFETILENG